MITTERLSKILAHITNSIESRQTQGYFFICNLRRKLISQINHLTLNSNPLFNITNLMTVHLMADKRFSDNSNLLQWI